MHIKVLDTNVSSVEAAIAKARLTASRTDRAYKVFVVAYNGTTRIFAIVAEGLERQFIQQLQESLIGEPLDSYIDVTEAYRATPPCWN